MWPSCWALGLFFPLSLHLRGVYNRIRVPNVANWCYQSKIVDWVHVSLSLNRCHCMPKSSSAAVIQPSLACHEQLIMLMHRQWRGAVEPLNGYGLWHRLALPKPNNDQRSTINKRIAIHVPLSAICSLFLFIRRRIKVSLSTRKNSNDLSCGTRSNRLKKKTKIHWTLHWYATRGLVSAFPVFTLFGHEKRELILNTQLCLPFDLVLDAAFPVCFWWSTGHWAIWIPTICVALCSMERGTRDCRKSCLALTKQS